MDEGLAQALPKRRLNKKQPGNDMFGPAPSPEERQARADEYEKNVLLEYLKSAEAVRLQNVWSKTNGADKRSLQSRLKMRKLRHWRSACLAKKAIIGDKEWVLSGDPDDEHARSRYSRRYLLHMCRDSSLEQKERAAAHSGLAVECAALVGANVEDTTDISGGYPILLTYNGNWGLIRFSDIPGVAAARSIDDVAVAVQNMEPIRFMEREVQGLVEVLLGDRVISAWAWSLELSPQSVQKAFRKEREDIRFHVHLFLRPCGFSISPHMLVLNTSRPHLAKTLLNRLGILKSRSQVAFWHACFYTAAKKIGSIQRKSSVEMFDDYVVLEGWVWNLVQMDKMHYDEAKKLFVRLGRNCAVHVSSLDMARRQRQILTAMEEQRADMLRLQAQQHPFKVLPEVERWKALFQRDATRYPFLILDGPSCVGKTRYIHSLVDVDACFYADCSNDQLPDLRSFNRGQHKLILLDEMGPLTAITLKKLLQSGLDVVTLGTSPTQQFAYVVYVHKIMICITSNNWVRDLKQLPPNDREWLAMNSHFLEVSEPLWVEPQHEADVRPTPQRRSAPPENPETPVFHPVRHDADEIANTLPLLDGDFFDMEEDDHPLLAEQP